MISKGNRPNAVQKKWLADIADYASLHGPVVFPCNNDVTQLHHVAGRSYKHNKVAIGHWFVIPLPKPLHDVHSNHELNVTHFKRRFTERYGSQRDLWIGMVGGMRGDGYKIPFEDDVIDAVMSTRF